MKSLEEYLLKQGILPGKLTDKLPGKPKKKKEAKK